ncbi:MAG: hypothetical protein M3Y09_14020 [Actinomycetota bacterium]|nr:hypothetical protein [Actinomycetota bacterium]
MSTPGERPAIAGLELELAGVLALLVLAGVLIVRAEQAVTATRAQLRVERNRRLDAEDLVDTKDKSIDGVLEALQEANTRADDLTRRLATHDEPTRPAGPAGTGGEPAAG